MSNFWSLSDGSNTEATETFDSGGGNLEPIPNNTGCLAAIEEAKWDSYEGDEYISLKWRVAQPQAYANRVIFQKIRVFDSDSNKADKAKRMLAAIDTNAGGKLMKVQGKPSDTDLMSALMGKMMGIKVMVWEMNDKSGNWISAVAPSKKPAQQAAPTKAASAKAATATEDDENFPF